jgi:hypothetical protein
LIDARSSTRNRESETSLPPWLGPNAIAQCGVSVGIAPTTGGLLEQVAGYLAEATGGSS